MSKPSPEPIDPQKLLELAHAVIQADRFPDLATIDGDQPRVRPVSPVRTDRFTVYVANLRSYHKTAEIAANPKVELCYLAAQSRPGPHHRHRRGRSTTAPSCKKSGTPIPSCGNTWARIDNPELIVYRVRPLRVRFMKEWALEYHEVPLTP